MSLSVHKNIDSKITKDLNNHSDIVKENNAQIKRKDGGIVNSDGNNDIPLPKITVLDIERENTGFAVLSTNLKDIIYG